MNATEKKLREKTARPAGRRAFSRTHRAPAAFLLLALLCGIVFVTVLIYRGRVYARAVVEAGDGVLSPSDFSKNGAEVVFAENFSPESVDLRVPGEYKVELRSGIFRYTSLLTVRDTVPPQAEPAPLTLSLGETCRPEDLVRDLKDQTDVTVSFDEKPDLSSCGICPVDLTLRDRGGNLTRLSTFITVIPLKTTLTWEAGARDPVPSDFILPGAKVQNLELLSPDRLSAAAAGDQSLRLSADGLICDCTLHVVDTTAPALVLRDVVAGVGQTVEARRFVESADDAGPVTFSAEFEKPLTEPGEQTVRVSAEDGAGNVAQASARLTLVVDTVPPVIHGVKALTAYLGRSANYLSGVRVTDDLDPEPELTVDTSRVDLKTEGTYPVTYIATDASGNRAEAKTELTVIRETYDEATVLAKAGEVLGTILTPGMTPREQLDAIYRWIRYHIVYRDAPSLNDWLQAAWQGMTAHYGDCYTFQMTARAMLTAAGIENRLIDTLPFYNVHCWNLVNIGEGWYHFDTTPFEDGASFCYVTTADLQNRSWRYPYSHRFDRDRFPDPV